MTTPAAVGAWSLATASGCGVSRRRRSAVLTHTRATAVTAATGGVAVGVTTGRLARHQYTVTSTSSTSTPTDAVTNQGGMRRCSPTAGAILMAVAGRHR